MKIQAEDTVDGTLLLKVNGVKFTLELGKIPQKQVMLDWFNGHDAQLEIGMFVLSKNRSGIATNPYFVTQYSSRASTTLGMDATTMLALIDTLNYHYSQQE